MKRITISLTLLAGINILMVSSLNPNVLLKQCFLWLMGLVFFFLGRHINPELSRRSQLWLFVTISLMLLIPLVSNYSTRGSRRWIDLGLISIQPSEISKPMALLFLANTNLPWLHLIPSLLVAIEPDLGSAITFVFMATPVILFRPKLLKIVTIIIAISIIASPAIWRYGLHEYQRHRITTFINPNSDPLGRGYNTIQSKIAVGSAGIFGKGHKKGSQGQLLFLPEKHTDFIFAATTEELGLVGAITIIICYYFIITALINKSADTNSQAQSSFTLCLAFLIWIQAFINIGMNIGVMPVTGIPLPFLSIGGSSLVSLMLSLGIAFPS